MNAELHKLVVACFETPKRDPAERRRVLLDEVAPDLLEGPATFLSVLVADEHVTVRSPNPFPLTGDRPVALVNVWLAHEARAEAVLTRLTHAGFTAHAWWSDESVYRDYGDNEHATPRDWPDGTRSPGPVAVSFLERPAGMTHDAWIEAWHGVMSPVSERIQPRTRYVRNVLTQRLTSGAPSWEGIVEEAWPSERHVSNPFLFYGARGPLQLARNMGAILQAVSGFTRVWRVTTVMMSEWFVRTPSS